MPEFNRSAVFQLISELNGFISESENLINSAFSSFSSAEVEIERRKKDGILELERWHANSLDNVAFNRDELVAKVERILSRIKDTDSTLRKNDKLYAKMAAAPPVSCCDKYSLYLNYSSNPVKKLEEFEKSYISLSSNYVKEKTRLSDAIFNKKARTTDFTEMVAISLCVNEIVNETIENLNQIYKDEKERIDTEYAEKNKQIISNYEREVTDYRAKKEGLILNITDAIISQLDTITPDKAVSYLHDLGKSFVQKLLGFAEQVSSPITLSFVNYNLEELVGSRILRETLKSKYAPLISDQSIAFPVISNESDLKPVYIPCQSNEAPKVYDFFSSVILGCMSNFPVGKFRCNFVVLDDKDNNANNKTMFSLLKNSLTSLFDSGIALKSTFAEKIGVIKKRLEKRNSMRNTTDSSSSGQKTDNLEIAVIAIGDDLDDSSLEILEYLIKEGTGLIVPLIIDCSKERKLLAVIKDRCLADVEIFTFHSSRKELVYRGLEVSVFGLPDPDQVEKYLVEFRERFAAYENEKVLRNLGVFGADYEKDATNGLLLPVMNRLDEERDICFLPIGTSVSTHTLITGNTSSGKSSFLHLIITSIITNYHPDDVELWLVDFGKVEFANYIKNRPPHIRFISLEKTEMFSFSFLEYLKDFFSKREKLFIDSGVSSIQEYRAKYGVLSLPRVVLIVDEFHVMTQHILESIEHRNLLENALAEYRKFGLSCIFSNQTISGLRGLSETGLLQIKNRIAMTNTIQEMTETLMVQRSNYSDEMFRSMERTRVGEFWFKEWVSPSDFSINKFKAFYLNGKVRSDAIEKVIDKKIQIKCDAENYVIEGDKRISIVEGLKEFVPSGPLLVFRAGVPSTIKFFFEFKLEQRYNNNVLLVGPDYDLHADTVTTMIQCCLLNSGVKPIIIADPSDEKVRIVSNLLEKLDLSITILSDYGKICDFVNNTVEKVNARDTFSERIVVFWLGIKDLFDEFKVLPEQRTNKKQEKQEKQTKEVLSFDASDLQSLDEDEELTKMAKEFGMSVSQFIESMSVASEQVEMEQEQGHEQESNDRIEYNASKDVMDIFAKGSKLGLFNVVCIDRLNDMNHSREFDLDCFTHKIVQAVPRDEAFSLGVGQVINDVTPGLNVVYSNGVISDIFKPFIV